MSVDIRNKKAEFRYFLTDRFTAGIQLVGTEIKSIRGNKASIGEAYCRIHKGELFVYNMYIAEYHNGGYTNHEPRRARKLLLNKHELRKIERKLKDVGQTVVTTRLFINEKGLAKLEIAIAKGKKLGDKRDSLKEKDLKREADRARAYR
ncbi:MAG: SsrA-binding protein SmpB [Flavobacteriales bacterium]